VYDASGRQLVADGGRYCPPEAVVNDRAPGVCDPTTYNLEVYQPPSRFWTFQWIEAGILAVLAAALLAFAVYRVRNRISSSVSDLRRIR
jgi:hypothetical protein